MTFPTSAGVYLLSAMLTSRSVLGSAIQNSNYTEGDVRLVGGSSEREGRVEMYYDGVWGTVCDDDWTLANAIVVCRQLGFSFPQSYLRYAEFGQGSGPILMDNVKCTGNEEKLQQCPFGGWKNTDCRHSEDAGVICSDHANVAVAGNCTCPEIGTVLPVGSETSTVSLSTPCKSAKSSDSAPMTQRIGAGNEATCNKSGLESWHLISGVLGGFVIGVVLTVILILIRDRLCLADESDSDEERPKRRSKMLSFRRRSTMKANPLYGKNRPGRPARKRPSTPTSPAGGTVEPSALGENLYAYAYVDRTSPSPRKQSEGPEHHNYDSVFRGGQRNALPSGSDSNYNVMFRDEPSMPRSDSHEAYCTLDHAAGSQ
eukprot:m.1551 g.1551  ORF g.1551 m.1551 type:complete len:371 (+) comp7186_c0_seq1:94-1206(+)